MRCTKYQFDNPEGLKFCNECGAPLKRQCAKCGFANVSQAKFCGECGASLVPSSEFPSSHATYTPPHLAERIRTEQEALEARGVTDGERKTITVLFADLKARRR